MRVLPFLLLLLLTSYLAKAQQPQAFSLEDCINYAVENNETLEIARLENEISVTQINETLARGLPQVDGSIGLTRNFDIQTSFI